ncbi:MAG: DUF5615 family PIN-like protein [Acidobacteriota bacterium]|nr:DUF5615 family PIN-like protein [Acidobacteriota bacterium]
MKRILLDQGLAARAAELLRLEGWDALHVTEVGLERAEDALILDFAALHRRICVTLDHDFHTHLALSRAGLPSAVFIRAEGLNAVAQAGLIQNICIQCQSSLRQGAAVSADGKTVRIRLLPLR